MSTEGITPTRGVSSLTHLGYQPQLVDGPRPSIELRPCPYLDLAHTDPDTACRLHFGLIRGLLHEADPWRATGLEPWATATKCVVRLRPGDEHS